MEHSLAVLVVPGPLPCKLVPIAKDVCPSAMFLPTHPIALVSFLLGVVMDSESLLFVLFPLAIIHGSHRILVDSPPFLGSLQEPPLVNIPVLVEVDPIPTKGITLPLSKVAVSILESIDALAVSLL